MSTSKMAEFMPDEPRPSRHEREELAACGGSGVIDAVTGCNRDGWFRTRDGHWLNHNAHQWSLPTPLGMIHIAIGDLPGVTLAMDSRFRLYLAGRLKVAPPANAQREHIVMRDFLRRTVVGESRVVDIVDLDMVLDYEAMVFKKQPDLWRVLRTLVGHLRKERSSLLAQDLLESFGSLPRRTPISQSPTKLRCARRGALDSYELSEALRQLRIAVSEDRLLPEDYIFCLLILVLGVRVSQCALIKVSDVGPPDEHGRRILQLKKMKRKSGSFGDVVIHRTLSATMSNLVADQVVRAQAIARSRNLDENVAALFPPLRVRSDIWGSQNSQWSGHAFPPALAMRFASRVAFLGIVSTRTGELLQATPIRGRRTMATRERKAGGSDNHIAEMLGHEGTKSVDRYAEPSREVAEAAARAMAREFDALAAAFRGSWSEPGDGDAA